MRRIGLQILATLLIAIGVAQGEVSLRDQFFLIKRTPEDKGAELERSQARLKMWGVADPSTVAAFFATTSFEKWKPFEDDDVRFLYPDVPGMRVERETRRQPQSSIPGELPETGGTDSWIYHITFGDIRWADLFLEKTAEFTPAGGGDFSGAIQLVKFLTHHGCLYSYSLLEDGGLKAMGVLGDGWNAYLGTWTALPLSNEVYTALAESVVLKHPSPRTAQEWQTISLERPDRRFRLSFGWLRRGMKTAEVLAVLGTPTRQSDRGLEYENIDREYWLRTTVRVPMRDGVFHGFSQDSWEIERVPPDRGTLAWTHEVATRFAATPPDKRHASFSKDARAALDSILQQAPEAVGRDWGAWCDAIRDLALVGIKDLRVFALVERRFLDATLPAAKAALVLHDCCPANRQALFKKRIRLTLDGTARTPRDQSLSLSQFAGLDELFRFLDSAKERVPFVREALTHPHPEIRESAARYLAELPAAEARAGAMRGLDDEASGVRMASARAWATTLATSRETAALEAKFAAEQDAAIRMVLEKAVARSKR